MRSGTIKEAVDNTKRCVSHGMEGEEKRVKESIRGFNRMLGQRGCPVLALFHWENITASHSRQAICKLCNRQAKAFPFTVPYAAASGTRSDLPSEGVQTAHDKESAATIFPLSHSFLRPFRESICKDSGQVNNASIGYHMLSLEALTWGALYVTDWSGRGMLVEWPILHHLGLNGRTASREQRLAAVPSRSQKLLTWGTPFWSPKW